MYESRLSKLLTQLYKEDLQGRRPDESKVFDVKVLMKEMLTEYIISTRESEYMSNSEKQRSIKTLEKLRRELDKKESGLVAIDQVLHTVHNMSELSETIGYSLPRKIREWLNKMEKRPCIAKKKVRR